MRTVKAFSPFFSAENCSKLYNSITTWKHHWTNTWEQFVGKIDDSYTSIQHYSANSCQHLVNLMVEKQGMGLMISFPTVRTWQKMWEKTCSWQESATRWKRLLWEQEVSSSLKRGNLTYLSFFNANLLTQVMKDSVMRCFEVDGEDFRPNEDISTSWKGWMLFFWGLLHLNHVYVTTIWT